MPGVGLRQRGMVPRRPVHPDPTHPLAAGLVFCLFSGNEQGRTGGSNVGWGMSAWGRSTATSDSASAFAVPIKRRWSSMSDWTMHAVVRVTAVDLGWASLFEVPHNPTSGSWSSPFHAFLISQSSANPYPGVATNNGASTYLGLQLGSGNYVLKDGLPHSYTASWGTLGAVWWRDGARFATSASTPAGSSALNPAVASGPEVVFGGRSAGTPGEGYRGDGVAQALWSRPLSDTEVAMAHADLMEMFRDGR